MAFARTRPGSRFRWAALRGRCRRNLAAGLVLLAVAIVYGIYAGQRFGGRGNDRNNFDQPVVDLATRLNPPPAHLGSIQPRNNRELYLVTVVSDQQDIILGLTVLVFRMIATLTIGGLGLVLLSAGSVEWEVRSESCAPEPLAA